MYGQVQKNFLKTFFQILDRIKSTNLLSYGWCLKKILPCSDLIVGTCMRKHSAEKV